MDNQTESRKAFEAWWKAIYENSYDRPKVQSVITKTVAWAAWQASLAAIVVGLPSGTGWASDPYNHGRNDGIHECAKSLRFIGITAKE